MATQRGDRSLPELPAAKVFVDVEPLPPGPLPHRRAADGALVEDWARLPARVYTAGLAGEGRRTMTSCAQAIAVWLSAGTADIDTLPWQEMRYAHTSAVRAALVRAVDEGRYSPATANKHLAALRGVLKAAWRMDMMGTDDYLRAVDLKPVSGSRLPAGRDVGTDELHQLLAVLDDDDTAGGVRDRALVTVAYFSGARRAELAGLDVADVDTDPLTLRVIGKAGKERAIPLPLEALAPLLAWIDRRGSAPGPLFCRVRGETVLTSARVSGEAIRQVLLRRAKRAGVASLSPHDLRRSCAGDLLDRGADLPTVQRLMGHSSPAVTSRYDRRDERTSRQAVERLTLRSLEAPREPNGRYG